MVKPKNLSEAVSLDDFHATRRKLEDRISKLEEVKETQETTMKDLHESIDTMNRAIMGDIKDPNTPGMAENLRSLTTNMDDLVELHKDEARVKAKALLDASTSKSTQTDLNSKLQTDNGIFSEWPWKAIIAALAVISALTAIIYKLIA